MTKTLPPRESPLWQDWITFLRAYKAVTERVGQDLADAKLPTLVEYAVLFGLNFAPDNRLRQVDVSRNVMVSKSRVTRVMHGLEAQGFVTREKTHADKRVTFAVLTPKGQEAFDRATPAFEAVFWRYFGDHLAPGDYGQVTRLLRPIANQTEGGLPDTDPD